MKALEFFRKKVECPRCLGKGDVSWKDIKRLDRESIWTPGICAYCLGAGKVTKKQTELISANNIYMRLSIPIEARNLLINGDEKQVAMANKLNKSAKALSILNSKSIRSKQEKQEIEKSGRFAVHKKGFFYTDEAFQESAGAKGTIIGFYGTKVEAKVVIEEADIETMLSMAGKNAVDFFFYSNDFDQVYQEFESHLKKKFGIEINDKFRFSFPEKMDRSDAIMFLELLNLSFHFVVEYDSIEGVDPNSFSIGLQDKDLSEF